MGNRLGRQLGYQGIKPPHAPRMVRLRFVHVARLMQAGVVHINAGGDKAGNCAAKLVGLSLVHPARLTRNQLAFKFGQQVVNIPLARLEAV